MLLLVAIGLISLFAQVTLLRELAVAFYGVELVYPVAIAVWLLWTSLGALGWRSPKESRERMVLLFVLLAILIPGSVAFLRGSRVVFGGVPGAYLPLLQQLLVVLLGLLPVGFLLGYLFQWAAKRWVARGSTLAVAYGIESLGAVLGGLFATGLLTVTGSNWEGAIVCALLCALVPFLAQLGKPVGLLRRTCSVVALASLVAVLYRPENAPDLDLLLTRWSRPHAIGTRDSPYGRITVTRNEGQVAVFENDALSFTTEDTSAEESVHLTALQHPRPQRILLLGGAYSGRGREVVKHGTARIDAVELDWRLVACTHGSLPRSFTDWRKNPRVTMTFGDPRAFLVDAAGSYDVILVGTSDPTSGQSNRFYTREFFSLCHGHLAPGGVLGFSVSSVENFLTPPMVQRLRSIDLAVRDVFAHALVLPLPSGAELVLASDSPLERDPGVLARRLEERRIQAQLVSAPYIEYVLTNDRLFAIERLLREATASMNEDANPACFRFTAQIWLSQFLPEASLFDVEGAVRGPVGAGVVLGVGVLIVWSRRRSRRRRAALAAIAGAAGMVLEAVWILYYQVKGGVLFQDIGLLLTVFMAGLAAGAVALDRVARSSRPWPRLRGPLLVGALAAFSAFTALAVSHGWASGLPGAALAVGFAGFLVSALFAHASLSDAHDQESIVSPLYAADLAGGCAAALLSGLVAIPILGMVATAGWTTALSLAAILLL